MKYIYLLFMMVAVSSCGIYRQNVVNVPMMQKKGQLQLAAQVSGNGTDAQGCYALSNKVAVLADYNWRRDQTATHYFGEGGVGLYKPAQSDTTATRNIQEIFFIAGFGMSTRRTYTAQPNSYEIQASTYYNRLCLQGNFGKSYKDKSWAVSPRLTAINFYNTNDKSAHLNNSSYNVVCLGGAFTVRHQLVKHLQFSWQFDATFPLSAVDDYYGFFPFNVSLGLVADMNLFGRRGRR